MIERLGTHYGGWWIDPTFLHKESIIYSAGVGEDISFDLELIKRFGCVIHGFDPTPRVLKWIGNQTIPKNYVFHPYGMAGFNGEEKFYSPTHADYVSHSTVTGDDMSSDFVVVPFKRLSTIMKELGHTYIDLLKMDIEGSEYEVIYEILHQNLDVRQLVLEFHRFGDFNAQKVVLLLKQSGYINTKIEGVNYSFVKESVLQKPITIGVTTRCPCMCRYCYPHLETASGIDIKYEDFVVISDILVKEGYNFVHLCGYGEPLLHKNIFDFIDILREKAIISNLITRLCCHVDWNRFEKSCPDRMLVTIDSLKPDVLKQISPGINPELVKDNLDKLAEIHRKHKFHLVFTTTVSALNYQEVPKIDAWLKEHFKRDGINTEISYSGKGMGLGFGASSPEEIAKAIKYAKDLYTDQFVEVRFKIENNTITPLYTKRCWPQGKTCQIVPELNVKGELLPCCHDPLWKCVIGNAVEAKTIDGLLKSEKGVIIVEKAKKLELPICKYCN